jgi:ATP-dependent helicase/nuclease subunit B
MACPYQFFARYVLGLGEFDEVQELIEKADYGRIVHEVLHGFHRDHREVSAIGLESACAVLERRSEEAFAAALARSPLALAWLERWRMQIPGYVGWQLEREAGGWRWHDGEAQREIALTTPAGAPLRLRGRLDRIDCHADGHTEVIDYKTRAENALKQQLKTPGEDVQLAVYALLWEAPVTAAQYLSLERDGVTTVPLPQPPQQAAAAVRERLLRLFDAMRAGAPLPAQGVQAACKYCEMRGLCRRGHWS